MSVLVVVAGPNGSGKSTLTSRRSFRRRLPVVDPDAIARELRESEGLNSELAAGRLAIQRCRDLLASRQSFALETTLAGNGNIALIRQAREAGYRTRLVYVALPTPELNRVRVRNRVARGGHDVPDEDIRRRYERSMRNAVEALGLVDKAFLFDNSTSQMRQIVTVREGRVVWTAARLPEWAAKILSSKS